MRSFHCVGMMRIFGSPISRTSFSVSSSLAPSATTNSSTIGSTDLIDATKGYPSFWPLRKKVNPLTFICVYPYPFNCPPPSPSPQPSPLGKEFSEWVRALNPRTVPSPTFGRLSPMLVHGKGGPWAAQEDTRRPVYD